MTSRTRATTMATMTLAVGITATLTGCVPNNQGANATALSVDSTASDCVVDAATAPSGPITFSVTNSGDQVTEFYILAEDKLRIVGEVENIAAGASRDLTVVAQPGTYYTVCKPGMIGEGIGQTEFTVSGKTVELSGNDKEAADAAIANYTAYVKQQVAELLPNVQLLADAYTAGDDEQAKALFPITRINYERIEPTAEQFGDLDPKIDYRKQGAEDEGLDFTGFHRIEMDLWLSEAQANYPDETITALDAAGRAAIAEQLVTDVTALKAAVDDPKFELTLGDITNGAIGLLDEVAAPDGKLSGEEDEFSHTDLYDFYANVEGAEVAFGNVRDIAASKGDEGTELVSKLDTQFAAMKTLLETYGNPTDGFVSYDTVDQESRKALGAQLNALSEPLATLTHTVLDVKAS
ncbi:iron uptake system protein EfeO [Lysinibacter cavernae]|uniref:Iron uptake system component EfeO n=1 Tax=Lysinibacter cavernae TaxID=1640652 RepID=A0A7X5TRL1_9MICO|nr:iron uptake system protein EfeO [Lysinibacter cavernae]NIH52326.1 iron uptake system component EfeO [Lysinibacter cavernae]